MKDYNNWFDKEKNDEPEAIFKEYEISAVPNDFNIKTIFDFIESGVVKIPGFQRNYVWDLKRASKLIESILIGIPIPQVFLFEKGKNDYLVIDGQQRLMTIYYFLKGRFPKKQSRVMLRRIFNEFGEIPDKTLHNDEYFSDFNLKLKDKIVDPNNILDNLNYYTLGDRKTTFDLRTIRNVFNKQNFPPEDDSSIFELFNRLNTGGINLRQQEIRACLYHSAFYTMLNKINLEKKWRKLIGLPEPDVNMKDIEYLLRGFSMLLEGDNYRGSLLKHLNIFSQNATKFKKDKIQYLGQLFSNFLKSCDSLSDNPFRLITKKFNISIYESVFVALCSESINKNIIEVKSVSQDKLDMLKSDEDFLSASEAETGRKINVEKRLKRAKIILK